jgi:hypothetical protein
MRKEAVKRAREDTCRYSHQRQEKKEEGEGRKGVGERRGEERRETEERIGVRRGRNQDEARPRTVPPRACLFLVHSEVLVLVEN